MSHGDLSVIKKSNTYNIMLIKRTLVKRVHTDSIYVTFYNREN